MKQTKTCKTKFRGWSGSEYNKDEVPIEFFTKGGQVLKTCKDCREYQNFYHQKSRQKRGQKKKPIKKILNETIEENEYKKVQGATALFVFRKQKQVKYFFFKIKDKC